jgi:uncharacterized membrane protein YqjE
MSEGEQRGWRAGLLGGVRRYATALLDAVQTRLDLLATEIQEERERLHEYALLAILSVFFLGLGVVLATGFVVVVFWDKGGPAVLGAFGAFYLAVGAWAGFRLRRRLRAKRRFLEATREELSRDRDRIAGRVAS